MLRYIYRPTSYRDMVDACYYGPSVSICAPDYPSLIDLISLVNIVFLFSFYYIVLCLRSVCDESNALQPNDIRLAYAAGRFNVVFFFASDGHLYTYIFARASAERIVCFRLHNVPITNFRR
jgi:hypothetical protein